jgi:hypothetical protein
MERCIICYEVLKDGEINHRPFCPDYVAVKPKKDKRKKK